MIAHGASPGLARALTAMARAKIEGLANIDAPDRATLTPTTLRQWSQEELKPAVDAACAQCDDRPPRGRIDPSTSPTMSQRAGKRT